ncbi:beta-ketoacyl synthase chain length factor [Vibrio sp.]|uniref:beta-ketoacyl synthase chain length factor n=1 Tax=Vibrio sp. TaxID=678 RepID=UPI003D1308AD
MSESSLQLQFRIEACQALSNGLNSQQDWLQWRTSGQWPEQGTADVSRIPAMMRRRMSNLSKLAVQTALSLLEQYQCQYAVFSSRHGELHRSVGIVESILAGDDASPMAFSQSVHNTAAGLATIAGKQPIPVTSIAAAENSFHSGLTDAWLYLDQHPQDRVLLVDFDEPLPEVYQVFEQQQYQSYALGLVLSHGDDCQITQTSTGNPNELLPSGLQFLHHYLGDAKRWQLNQDRLGWEWQRR